MRAPTTLAVFAIILGATAISQAQPNAQDAVELSNGARVPQKVGPSVTHIAGGFLSPIDSNC